jgi:hypothetical protein
VRDARAIECKRMDVQNTLQMDVQNTLTLVHCISFSHARDQSISHITYLAYIQTMYTHDCLSFANLFAKFMH